eukprot:scaffold54832_cov27-Phaeocystis_antarctica.AAC.1
MDTFDLVSKERVDTLRPACQSVGSAIRHEAPLLRGHTNVSSLLTSGDGGSRVAMSDETTGSDAAAPGGGDARDDYKSAMESGNGAARAWKRRHEAEDASGEGRDDGRR